MRRASEAVKIRRVLDQYVEGLSGEAANLAAEECGQACRSREGAIVAETIRNHTG